MELTRLCGAALVAGLLVACGNAASDSAASSKATASAAAASTGKASASPAASASAKVASKEKPKIKPRAKADLDEKKPPHAAASAAPAAGASAAPEAPPGEIVAIPGTDGQFLAPNGWKIAKGADVGLSDGWIVAGSADGKAAITATAYPKGEDPTGKIGEIATTAKFTDCSWNDPQDAKLGIDEIPAKVSDGVCLDPEGKWNYMMYAIVEGGDLNVLFFMGTDVEAPDSTAQELGLAIATIHKKK